MENSVQIEIETEIERFIIKDALDFDSNKEIDHDVNLFTSGLLDSMSIMRLIAHLQVKYDYKIPPKDLIPDNFKTIKLMANYIKQKTKQNDN